MVKHMPKGEKYLTVPFILNDSRLSDTYVSLKRWSSCYSRMPRMTFGKDCLSVQTATWWTKHVATRNSVVHSYWSCKSRWKGSATKDEAPHRFALIRGSLGMMTIRWRLIGKAWSKSETQNSSHTPTRRCLRVGAGR